MKENNLHLKQRYSFQHGKCWYIDGVIGDNMAVTLVMILCPEIDSIDNIAGQARPHRNLIYFTCEKFFLSMKEEDAKRIGIFRIPS